MFYRYYCVSRISTLIVELIGAHNDIGGAGNCDIDVSDWNAKVRKWEAVTAHNAGFVGQVTAVKEYLRVGAAQVATISGVIAAPAGAGIGGNALNELVHS